MTIFSIPTSSLSYPLKGYSLNLFSRVCGEGDKDVSDKPVTDPTTACMWKGFAQDLQVVTFDLFSQHRIKAASLGSQHCLFLTYENLVFVQGNNELGQLGQGLREIQEAASPMLVSEISCKFNLWLWSTRGSLM